MGYIYILTNRKNGKKYVGMTTQDIDKRIYEYKNPYSKETRPINLAIRKHGWENFELETIDCDNWFLLDEEERYIKKYNTLTPHGYNILPRGGDKTIQEKMQLRKYKRFVEMCINESEEDIVEHKEREIVKIYDYIEKECRKWTNGYSNFYEELANDALDYFEWLREKTNDIVYIKYEIAKTIKANYERRRKNEPYAAKRVQELYDFEFDEYRNKIVNDAITKETLKDNWTDWRKR